MQEISKSLMAVIPDKMKPLVKKKIAQNLALSISEMEQLRCDDYNLSMGKLEGYNCLVCLNKGFIACINKADRNMTLAHCTCHQTRKDLLRIKNSGLANVLDKKSFDNYHVANDWQKNIKKSAIDFADNDENKWFFIGGQVGCGKTHLCTAIIGQKLKQGKSCKYMLWRDEVVKITSNVNDDVIYHSLINPLKTVEVLYIDDFFKTPQSANIPTQGELKVAFELLNYRYNSNSVTIISSEHTADRIVDFEESVGSRIYEMTKGESIAIGRDKTKNYRLSDNIKKIDI